MINVGKSWRTLATGACFLIFTTGALSLSCVVLPVLRVFTRDREALRRRTRFFVQRFFSFMTWLIEASGCMRLKVEGAERLRAAGGALIFANHPTLIDVVVLMGLIPQSNCVIKSALFRKLALGHTLRSAGYVENGDPDRLVEDCRASLDAGRPLIIFPEGTRTTPGAPLAFQRGPAHILLASRRPILPVLITCCPAALLKGQPWYHVPATRFELELRVLEPISAEDWLARVEGLPRPLAVRALTSQLESFFFEQLTARSHAHDSPA
jgi:1-acyl-sn-glycerol-3-phosphate acyltransferase